VDQIIRIGMDTSKHVFQLHGVNGAEEPVLRKKLRRQDMITFFEKLPPTVIGIEACGGSHHWARLLQSLGHQVRMLPPQFVKPYLKRGKNDAADAEALCEAMSRPTMRFVPVKTAEQQAALMLVGLRDRLIRQRTQLANAIRGYAAEFGLIVATGICRIEPLLERIRDGGTLPPLARELVVIHAKEYAQLQARLEEVEDKLMAWHRTDECSRRLAKIPGVGPIGASMLVMKTPTPEAFRSARHFAAWLGLTPKDHSTAGKVRLGGSPAPGTRPCAACWWSGLRLSFDSCGGARVRPPRPGRWRCSSASHRSWSRSPWPTRSPGSPGNSWCRASAMQRKALPVMPGRAA
jgi:transposase